MRVSQAVPAMIAASLATVLAALFFAAGAQANVVPAKLLFEGYFGRQVNLTQVKAKGGPELEDVCLVESGDECQAGRQSSIAGGYSVAGNATGGGGEDVYVADMLNHRVQELTPAGRFVMMFGKQVNQTEAAAHAGPELEDVCTAVSGDVCQAGVESTEAGELARPVGIAVDAEGDVYVAEYDYSELGGGKTQFGERVQKFTGEGRFLLEIGRGVNATSGGNVCTRVEQEKGSQCGATVQRQFGAPFEWGGEAGAFNFEFERADLIAAGGPEDRLYVGDENRIQEFKPDGTPAEEIPLEPAGLAVRALAVESTSGDVYFVYGNKPTIERRAPSGQAVGVPIEVGSGLANEAARLRGMALDSEGRLAVAVERTGAEPFGDLYEAATGRLMTTFKIPGLGVRGLGFDGSGRLYGPAIADPPEHGEEIYVYTRKLVAELTTGAVSCTPGVEGAERDTTFDCTLAGEVNTEGVSETEAWFEWGLTEALGERTPKQAFIANGPASAAIVVRPNTPVHYRLAAEDQNVKSPEQVAGETRSTTTRLAVPRIVGAPSASFLTPSSAVLSGQVNPENAETEFFFEYAASEAALIGCPGVRAKPEECAGVAATPIGRSSIYGQAPATLEAIGLQPGTTYAYRLAAESRNATETAASRGEGTQIGSFETPQAPVPRARTGPTLSVSATGAVISGVVEPDGLPATYSFELGVYAGTATQYGIVFSGQTGSVSTEESLSLTGLHPGTEYAYRISISSGYIANPAQTVIGETAMFKTEGLPSALVAPPSLPLLPLPSTTFPVEAKKAVGCRHGYVRDRHGRCVKAKPKRRRGKKAHKSIRRSLPSNRRN